MPFGLDRIRPAIVAIDLHRGHLDPTVATLPVQPGTERAIIDANRDFLRAGRRLGVPVLHLVTCYQDAAEIRTNPFWHAFAEDEQSTRANQERHNLSGSPGTEVIGDLLDPARDTILATKRRYNCFVGTDLDFVLRARSINMVVLTGVNTNSCVLATATAACSLDYAVVVVTDCVASMDGAALHEAALQCIGTAFGWVMDGSDAIRHVLSGNATNPTGARVS